ncbi:sensor histidine kinase [Tunicatimonas pelagia]|uniref:sensor histidine kinase n=1 Tax=Tunicatimonas pelagia TaxID=931531 RepID=UPI002666883C|nr:HAMP domain-containing sensor histidine kinase [Tunicatimonas pelagia]WKN43179.1 HAMP domain-containing sensor histidine kinase [Tunicatimonas pelagia]
MPRSLTKVGLVLLIVFLLPAIFYSVRELQTAQENELLIEEIYNDQLEAILFSVNQYSEDIARSWTRDWSNLLQDSLWQNSEEFNQFFSENYAIKEAFIMDSLEASEISLYSNEGEAFFSVSQEIIPQIIQAQRPVVHRLFNYRENGYLKIEPFFSDTSSLEFLVFLPTASSNPTTIYGFILDPTVFVNDFLGPRIHAIAQEELIISVHQQLAEVPLYTTANHVKHGISRAPRKPLWLFPDYYLTIQLEEQEAPTLAEQRFRTNLFLIVGLNAVLLLGAWFVFRTIKKEIELARIKSDFVSNVSHEIRTPLALISMFSETLMMGRVKSEEKKHEYYRIVNQESQRLTSMVNKILNFSKIEAGKHHFHFEPINLNEVVTGVLESYDFHLKNEGFHYHSRLSETELTINGDRESITEAIINLLDNAIKYSDEHKDISVLTGISADQYFVEIQDKGMGISEANQEAIFDKFFRVSSSLPTKPTAPSSDGSPRSGTGLGLSLVKYIMDAHKGTITLTSYPNKGSNFRLNFPICYRVGKLIANE